MSTDYPVPPAGASADASARSRSNDEDSRRARRFADEDWQFKHQTYLRERQLMAAEVAKRTNPNIRAMLARDRFGSPLPPWDMERIEDDARFWAALSPEEVLVPHVWHGHLGLPEGRRGRFLAAGVAALPEEIRVVTLDRLRGGAA